MTASDIEVRTAGGVVRGRRENDLAVFRGIPFAQPPVGALRFAAPQPTSWEGVREAVAFGPAPPQSGPARAPGSEGDDWLTVNVWSPDPGGARLPVLVWIYGGAYMAGSSGDPVCDAALLAREGVVVVSFNYRVGIEGFAQLDGAPANRGLLDQLAALRWVRENVEHFGGDPDLVTVCGQSAGAGSIATLLAMPQAAGLFRRAIAQSVPGLYCTPALAADVAAQLAARLGTAPTATDLAGIEPARLAEEVDALSADMPGLTARWGRLARTGVAFVPVVDGEVVPDVPWRALTDGRGAGVELLTGHTRDEFRLFLAMAGQSGSTSQKDATIALRALAPAPDGQRAYREGFPDASAEMLVELVYSDATFRIPTLRLAETQAAAGAGTFLYELRWPSPAMGGVLGACHGLDVPLLFGTFDSPAGRTLLGEEELGDEVVALSALMRRAWTAFATTGDPGWPAYETDRQLACLLDTKSTAEPYPEQVSQRIWHGHELDPFDLVT